MKNSSQKPIELNESKWNKYSLYLQSVQSPETDALFLQKIYKKLNLWVFNAASAPWNPIRWFTHFWI